MMDEWLICKLWGDLGIVPQEKKDHFWDHIWVSTAQPFEVIELRWLKWTRKNFFFPFKNLNVEMWCELPDLISFWRLLSLNAVAPNSISALISTWLSHWQLKKGLNHLGAILDAWWLKKCPTILYTSQAKWITAQCTCKLESKQRHSFSLINHARTSCTSAASLKVKEA